ncbi:CesT family type III secretion system chaperone [Pseudoduganella namucuonensis]|uniref:Tir chaperone protein (CesT) family protein n=1 Tax=Pseudoduganella namucuonensis TaxID=1035707 RepID=A0A1I7M6J6_9BURK|nr:CesT family type III secretion system chaperone [Pseudoduganella namucuonensis]SFV17517.1 Tir chaperone protein (CesT) family protein [Pseudoduganella namucuonensis]
MTHMRINPSLLGAIPSRDAPSRWSLSNPQQLQMTIACPDADDLFTAAIRIATLLPDAQAYQLAAALMLNSDSANLNGGAVAYNVHDDSFLYCKAIDARQLTLSAFRGQVEEGFATAATLRELLLHAQEDVGPQPSPSRSASTLDRLSMREPS